jgi:hypothetical protein
MGLLRIGPDGLLLVHGLLVSALLAFLSWRRVPLGRAVVVTTVAVLAIAGWEFRAFHGGVNHPMLTLLFIFVPSALLFWASRASWVARRAWMLVLLGPIVFVVDYVGICVCAVRVIGLAT